MRVEESEKLLVVSYRHMYVREIDREQDDAGVGGAAPVGRTLRSPSGSLRVPPTQKSRECEV